MGLPRTRGRTRLMVRAFGPNPYEPLERAIQIVNKVITIGEKTKWKGTSTSVEGSPDSLERVGKERWVQFGAVTSAKVPVALSSLEEDAEGLVTAQLLREYLALPTSEYSLLDPKWVERDGVDLETDTFIIKIPLQDIVGVDLTPTISIVAHPQEEKGKVTFVGSKASLGSPGLDESFTLSVVAVLNSKNTNMRSRTLPRMIPKTGHLPGRPVHKLKNWAAYVRRGQNESHVMERDEEQEQVLDTEDKIDCTIDGHGDAFPVDAQNSNLIEGSNMSFGISSAKDEVEENSNLYLQCRVNVTIAVRVPTGLKVIPNPLLGYAGSLITKSVLHAAVPNFANLLGKDFENWATQGKMRDDSEPVGDMFDIVEVEY